MKYFLISLTILLFFVIPFVLFAQTSTNEYTLLEPIGDFITQESAQDLGSFLAGAFRLGVAVATALAVVMIIYGGIIFMTTESVRNKTDARGIITNAIFGLILALGSYLIAYTINPELVEFRFIETLSDIGEEVELPEGPSGGPIFPPTELPSGSPWPSDATERAFLARNGITLNNTNCTQVGQTGCTSVSGLPNLSFLSQLSRSVGGFVITGGTEYWLHSTHGAGQPIVDIRPSAAINELVTGSSETPDWECFRRATVFNATFSWEGANCTGASGDHWHVTYPG